MAREGHGMEKGHETVRSAGKAATASHQSSLPVALSRQATAHMQRNAKLHYHHPIGATTSSHLTMSTAPSMSTLLP